MPCPSKIGYRSGLKCNNFSFVVFSCLSSFVSSFFCCIFSQHSLKMKLLNFYEKCFLFCTGDDSNRCSGVGRFWTEYEFPKADHQLKCVQSLQKSRERYKKRWDIERRSRDRNDSILLNAIW